MATWRADGKPDLSGVRRITCGSCTGRVRPTSTTITCATERPTAASRLPPGVSERHWDADGNRPDDAVAFELDFGLAKAMAPVGAMSMSQSMSPTITLPALTQAG